MRDLSPGQFGQLPMFLPAKALADPANVLHRDLGWNDRADTAVRNDTVGAMMGRKVTEAKRDDRYDSIKSEGVREPVTLYRPPANDPHRAADNAAGRVEMMDGHHRLAVTHDVDPNREVPVAWYDPFISR